MKIEKYKIDEILEQFEPEEYDDNYLVECNANLFKELPEELQKDRNFVLKALEINGAIYLFLSDELKKDVKIAITSINSYPESYRHLPYELLDNEKVIEEAIKNNQFGAELLEYASEIVKKLLKNQ